MVSEHRLPLTTALEAATTALHSCAAAGAKVSVSVVDQHGLPIVKIQGDGAAPHTLNLSEQKAFTAVSLAPIQGVTRTSEVAANLRASHQPVGALALPAAPIPGIVGLPGGLIINSSQGELLGGLGVSGASNSTQDETCAEAGLRAIENNLNIT
jgi:uncharacterized protein GlcG (DUF336 family)